MENKKKYVKIKFIPTGLEFDVLEKESSELLKNEPENFEAVDGYTLPVEPEEKTVYSSIVVEEEATETEPETETEVEVEVEPTEETVVEETVEEEATEEATSNTNNKNKKK